MTDASQCQYKNDPASIIVKNVILLEYEKGMVDVVRIIIVLETKMKLPIRPYSLAHLSFPYDSIPATKNGIHVTKPIIAIQHAG